MTLVRHTVTLRQAHPHERFVIEHLRDIAPRRRAEHIRQLLRAGALRTLPSPEFVGTETHGCELLRLDVYVDPTCVARSPDLGVQRTCGAPLVLGPPGIGHQRPPQRCLERAELVRPRIAPVLRCLAQWCAQLRHRVARQSCHARYLALRQLVPHVQPPDPSIMSMVITSRTPLLK